MKAAARDLARAMHRHARTHGEDARRTFRGEVIDSSPLTIRLLERDATFSTGDFDATLTVARHIAAYGLDVGDNVVVIDDGDTWLVIDVLADSDPQPDFAAAIADLTERVEALENPA